MPESENRTKYAVNPETGQVMRNDGTGWKKVQTAKNQAGDILINENGAWGPVPGRSAQPAPVGFASVPKMSMGQAAQVAGAQGREIGLSDEARGFRAMAGIPEGLNQAYQAINPLGRFTSIGTGLAGLAGEAMGVMPERYTQARDVERQQLAQARTDRPVTAFGSELSQAAVYPAGTLRMGAPLVGQMAKLGGIGAAQGGVMGYAAGEGDTESRLQAGGIGTVAGGVLGAAMPGLGAAATPVYRAGTTAVANAVDAVVRLFGGTSNLADANARRVAEAAVRRSMERSNMTPEQIAANLERFRDKPAVLAEIIGQDALNALTALTRRPGATPEMAQDIIAGRFGGLGERIASDVRQAAPGVSEEQIAGEFGPELARRRAEAAPAYTKLFKEKGGVMSPRLRELIDTDTMRPLVRTAVSRVREKAIREKRNPDEITPLEILDYAKQKLDDRINIAKKNKQTTLLADLTDLKKQVVSELDLLTKGQYAEVRKLGGEAPRLVSAKDLGEKWRTIRLPQFVKELEKINPQDRSALQAGIVAQIDDRLNRGTLNPREFRTRDVQEKIRAVFGPEAGDELIRRITAEAELRETGARFAPRVQSVTGTVAENAPEEFLNDAIGVVEQVRRGNIAGTMQAIGSFMRRRGYGQRQIDEMGRLLLSDPEEGLRRLGISLPTAPGGGGTAANAFTAGGGGPAAGGPSGGAGPTPNAMAAPAAATAPETGNAFTTPYLGRRSMNLPGPVTGPATQARMADWEATVPALAQVSNTGQQASEVAAQALQNRTPEALAAAQQAKAMLRSEIEGIVQTRAGMATPEDQRLVDALSALTEQTNDPVLIGTQISNARLQLDRVLESLGQQRPGNLTPVRTTPPFRVTPSPEQQARTIPDRQSRTRYAGGTPPDETQMGLGPNAFIQAGLGSAGGSVAGSTTDLNGDGVIDMQDVAIGSVMGGVGLPLAGRAASRLDNALAGNRGVRGMGINEMPPSVSELSAKIDAAWMPREGDSPQTIASARKKVIEDYRSFVRTATAEELRAAFNLHYDRDLIMKLEAPQLAKMMKTLGLPAPSKMMALTDMRAEIRKAILNNSSTQTMGFAGIGPNAFVEAGIGSVGGSVAGQQYDITGDGVIDERDMQAGALMGMAGVPLAARMMRGGGSGMRGMGYTGEMAQPQIADRFFSGLQKAVQGMKPERASAEQWKGMLNNAPGVKKEELEWTGVIDWLDAQEGQVSKADLDAYVRGNGVRVEEVVKGGAQTEEAAAIQRELLPLIEQRDRIIRDAEQGVDILEIAENNDMANLDDMLDNGDISRNTYNRVSDVWDLNSEIQALEDEFAMLGNGSDTKYSTFTLPGGENYTELLLKLPKGPGYQSSHWSDPNVVAHVRFKDRTGPNGERILAMEEIQSDWHQAGRKQGYGGSIPNAPFKNEAWVNLALNRMIRHAAEEGYDGIAWVPGNIQNGSIVKAADNRGDFYDKIVVNAANKIGKKYGAKSERLDGVATTKEGEPVSLHYMRVTPELKRKALEEGFPLFAGLPFAVGGAGLGMGAMQSEERPNAFVQ